MLRLFIRSKTGCRCVSVNYGFTIDARLPRRSPTPSPRDERVRLLPRVCVLIVIVIQGWEKNEYFAWRPKPVPQAQRGAAFFRRLTSGCHAAASGGNYNRFWCRAASGTAGSLMNPKRGSHDFSFCTRRCFA